MTEVRHTVPASELARMENRAKRGHPAPPWQVLRLINTIHSLSRRLQVRFNETVQARQDAAAARERAESADRQAEIAERNDRALRELLRSETYLVESERERAETYRVRIERAENQVAQARQIARVHGEAGIRERFGVKPDEDLYDGLSRRVGELQTSEAELVSAPLKKRVAELEARNQRLVDEMARHNREKDSRIAELERSVQARNRLLDSSSRAKREVHELVWAEGVDRAMEDFPPYPDDESDQMSAEEEAGGYLVQVIKEVREALSDKDTPQEELNDQQSLEYQRVLTNELEQSVQVRDRLLVAFTTANLTAHHLVWAEGVTDALKYEEAVPAPDGHWKRLAQAVREVREALSDKDTPVPGMWRLPDEPPASVTVLWSHHGTRWERHPTQNGHWTSGPGNTMSWPSLLSATEWLSTTPPPLARRLAATGFEVVRNRMTAHVHGQTWTTVGGRQVQIGAGGSSAANNPGGQTWAATPAPADDCLRTYREVLERSGEVCNICAYSAERHPRASDAS